MQKENNQQLENTLRNSQPNAYFQLFALLAEIFYRWGELDKALACVKHAPNLIDAIEEFNESGSKSELLGRLPRDVKEQIRYCLAYIEATSFHDHENKHYSKAQSLILACQQFVEKQIRNKDEDDWSGTRALLDSHLGRVLRNKLSPLTTRKFGQSLSHYEARLLRPYRDPYKNSKVYRETEKTFVQHRAALILILGYGWTNIIRGQSYVALYNCLFPARAILSKMNDVLANNYLELLEVAAMRWLSLPLYANSPTDIEPVFNAAHVYDRSKQLVAKFRSEMGSERFVVRVLYEHALCAEYCLLWDESERCVDEMISISETVGERYWRTRGYLLKARILTRRYCHEIKEPKRLDVPSRFELSKGEIRFDEIRSCFSSVGTDHKAAYQTELEYHMYWGEAFSSKLSDPRMNLDLAIEHLRKAINLNRDSNGSRPNDALNPKIEAACRLQLARIYIGRRQANLANIELEVWKSKLSYHVDDIYLHYLSSRIENDLMNVGVISIDPKKDPEGFNYKAQHKRLVRLLLAEASYSITNEGDNTAANQPNWSQLGAKLGIGRKKAKEWWFEMQLDRREH